jgi:hypothetical protein
MIDKYNTRLNRVSELLDELSSTIDILLSLVRDIRNTLGQCKQRVYNNLDQVKEVIDGNGITGTDSTIDAIENALETGDRAINEAEIQLENIEAAISCSEEYSTETDGTIECGESCNQTSTPTNTDQPSSCSEPYSSDCSFCSYDAHNSEGTASTDCTVCAHGDCAVDVSTGDPCSVIEGDIDNCAFSSYTDFECGETYVHDGECSEYGCLFSGSAAPDCSNDYGTGCTFSCSHSSPCAEYAMPENCTYGCVDGEGCLYADNDCSYGTMCGESESGDISVPCNESSCSQYDCGEPCGETCYMITEDDGDCSETSCGECSDELSEDDYYGGDDCGEACGEDCGDSCGL